MTQFHDLYPNYGQGPWYGILAQDKYVRYFSDPNNRFFMHAEGDLWLEPLYQDFADLAIGIACAITQDVPLGETPLQQLGYQHCLVTGCNADAQPPSRDSDPRSLTAEQLAVMILSPFFQSEESTGFVRSGTLGSYLSLLSTKLANS